MPTTRSSAFSSSGLEPRLLRLGPIEGIYRIVHYEIAVPTCKYSSMHIESGNLRVQCGQSSSEVQFSVSLHPRAKALQGLLPIVIKHTAVHRSVVKGAKARSGSSLDVEYMYSALLPEITCLPPHPVTSPLPAKSMYIQCQYWNGRSPPPRDIFG